ncbi:hypothetical protein EW145_g7038 [Phellinidium pouzarii]|uniref:Uncharacterized protein n=1 Tax=Phellinidium pouzarii TaxID=167371 RepID=A0A4V3XB57_9AGAM|nr:hypothetical protein EW145_g7038 [Phellinidium pouzarii]
MARVRCVGAAQQRSIRAGACCADPAIKEPRVPKPLANLPSTGHDLLQARCRFCARGARECPSRIPSTFLNELASLADWACDVLRRNSSAALVYNFGLIGVDYVINLAEPDNTQFECGRHHLTSYYEYLLLDLAFVLHHVHIDEICINVD